jgi:hypothetical protein
MNGANINVDVGDEDEVSTELDDDDEGLNELKIVLDAWTWVITAMESIVVVRYTVEISAEAVLVTGLTMGFFAMPILTLLPTATAVRTARITTITPTAIHRAFLLMNRRCGGCASRLPGKCG